MLSWLIIIGFTARIKEFDRFQCHVLDDICHLFCLLTFISSITLDIEIL